VSGRFGASVRSRSPLLVIFITVFIDLIGFGIIIPLLPFYAETFGASALVVGMLSTSFSLMQFLFAPFWGRLSDVIGRRPVILLGLLGSCLSYLAFAFATSLPMLFLARSLAGIAGANIPTAQAFIADSTEPENRARGMGLVGAAFGLGFIFGPAIGGFLSRWGYAAPALFASALSFANFVAAYWLLPESRPSHARTAAPRVGRLDAFRRAIRQPGLGWVLLVMFLVMTAFSAFEATFALYSEERFGFTASTIGYVFAWVGVVLATVQGLLVGRVARRVGEHRIAPVAILILAVALCLVALSWSPLMLAMACGLLAVGMGFHSPSMLSVVSQMADPHDQGSMLGLTQSLASLARIIGPLWGGWVFDRFGIDVPLFSAAGLMLVACVMSVLVFSRYRPRRRYDETV
jgi:MFS transporter, DHA1 family, tetracycline resistance protein